MSGTDDEGAGPPGVGVETVPLDAIDTYDNNPKQNADAVALLTEAIPKFGFKVPVVLDDTGTVVAGHARCEAVSQLAGTLDQQVEQHRDDGHESLADNLAVINDGQVFALRAAGLTDDEVQEFRIADNRVQELSDWDDQKLQFELREIEEAVGFSDDEIDDIISPSETPDVTTDDIEDAEAELESHYEELAEAKQDRKSKLPCPHCDSWIRVDVEELERALKREGVLEGEDPNVPT